MMSIIGSSFGRSGLWMAVRQGVVALAGLVLAVIMVRLTSEQVYGEYQLVLAFVGLASIASLPGFGTSIIQATARGYEGNYQPAVRIRFFWSGGGSLALLLLGFYYCWSQSYHVGFSLMIASLFFPFIYSFGTWESFLQGKSRFDLSTIYYSIQLISQTVVVVIALMIFGNNLLVITSFYLASLALFSWWWFWKSKQYIENNEKDDEAIGYGWFLTKTNALAITAGHLDKVLVGILLNPVDLAVYAVGYNFSRRFLDLTKNILSVTAPKIAQSNTVDLKNYLKIFIIFVLITLFLYWLFPLIMPVLFSEKYKQSVFLSQLVIAFLPFFALNALYKTHFLFYLRKKNILLAESLIFPATKILLMAALIGHWGIAGLAFLAGAQSFLDLAILFILQKIFR